MGRTNPTYRDALRAIEDRWSGFRRALRRRDQPRFDRLFAYAREHADASGLLNHRRPVVPALFSVALEQERRLDAQDERLDAVEDRLDVLDDRLAALEEPGSLDERSGPDDGAAVGVRSGHDGTTDAAGDEA